MYIEQYEGIFSDVVIDIIGRGHPGKMMLKTLRATSNLKLLSEIISIKHWQVFDARANESGASFLKND